MSLETSTEFMGVRCDGSLQSGTIARALVASPDKKLSVREYVDSSGFKIDQLMLNEFWQIVAKNRATHVRSSMLEWLGYEGKPYHQKQMFTDYLKRNEIAYEQLRSSDDRINEYPTIADEMKEMRPVEISKAKWLVMNSRDFKKEIIKLSTKKGNDIREYYLNVEELLQEYVEYDKRFEIRKREEEAKVVIKQKDDKIDELKRLMQEIKAQNAQLLDDNANAAIERNTLIAQNNDLQQDVTTIGRRLGAACVDRAPRPLNPIKRERFLFIRWTNLNYHSTIPADYHCPLQTAKRLVARPSLHQHCAPAAGRYVRRVQHTHTSQISLSNGIIHLRHFRGTQRCNFRSRRLSHCRCLRGHCGFRGGNIFVAFSHRL